MFNDSKSALFSYMLIPAGKDYGSSKGNRATSKIVNSISVMPGILNEKKDSRVDYMGNRHTQSTKDN